jgi:hypothetical protein
MILRRIANHMKQQHWTGVFIELVIVILGVFIGLQVDNWNAARISNQNQRFILRELRSDLIADSAIIDNTLHQYRRLDHASSTLLRDLGSGDSFTPAMDKVFGNVYVFVYFNFHLAAYESLKSQGMDRIRNPALRTEITTVYEQTYPLLETVGGLSQHYYLNVIMPYFLKHFKNLHVAQSATPLDYASTRNDPYFRNIIANRRDIVRNRYIPFFERASLTVHHLIASIDRQLGEPKPGEHPG